MLVHDGLAFSDSIWIYFMSRFDELDHGGLDAWLGALGQAPGRRQLLAFAAAQWLGVRNDGGAGLTCVLDLELQVLKPEDFRFAGLHCLRSSFPVMRMLKT